MSRQLLGCVSCEKDLSNSQSKLLPCLHSICNECINVLNNDSITCCSCNIVCKNEEIIDHPIADALYLQQLKQQLPKCSSCQELKASGSEESDGFAAFVCLDCPESEHLCLTCAQAHRRVKLTRSHRLKEIDTVKSDFERKCSKHVNERLCLYCVPCNEMTCTVCQLDQHNGHKHQPTETLIKSLRSEINNTLLVVDKTQVKIKRYISKTDQRLVDLETEKDEMVKNLNRYVEELKTAIDKRSEFLKLTIRKYYDGSSSETLENIRVAENLKCLANQATAFAQDLLVCDDYEAMGKGRKCFDSAAERILDTFSKHSSSKPNAKLTLHCNFGNVLNEIDRFGELKMADIDVKRNSTDSESFDSARLFKNIFKQKEVKNDLIVAPVFMDNLHFPETITTMYQDLWQHVSALSIVGKMPLSNFTKRVKMTRPSEDAQWIISGELTALKGFEDAISFLLGLREEKSFTKSTQFPCTKTNNPLDRLISDMNRLNFDENLSHEQKSVLPKSFFKKPDNLEEKCPICLSDLLNVTNDDNYAIRRLSNCSHRFHKSCVDFWLKRKASCPVCQKPYGPVKGSQPPGTIAILGYHKSVAGFPDSVGSIAIKYEIPAGIQGLDHPNPGMPYSGTVRIAFLPNTVRGKKIAKLLRLAFQSGLIFSVGTSSTSGVSNTVVWSSIPHKTSLEPGPYGYPDENYLDAVEEALLLVGITEDELFLL